MEALNPIAAVAQGDFQAWLQHPVTEWVLAALKAQSEAQREQWERVSWHQGEFDPDLLIELRTRADTFRAIEETTYEGFCGALGEEPNVTE